MINLLTASPTFQPGFQLNIQIPEYLLTIHKTPRFVFHIASKSHLRSQTNPEYLHFYPRHTLQQAILYFNQK